MTYESSLILEEKASFVQSDPLLSLQFLNTYGGRTQQEPERMLMLAVLEDAVTCIQKYASVSKGKEKRWFREAMEWILTTDYDWVFSFNNVCEAVGMSSSCLRRALIRMARSSSCKARELRESSKSTKRRRKGVQNKKEHRMQCRRCLKESEKLFRVYTDELDTIVCAPCADKARRLGLPVESIRREINGRMSMVTTERISIHHPASKS
jgi:hypothetical protein